MPAGAACPRSRTSTQPPGRALKRPGPLLAPVSPGGATPALLHRSTARLCCSAAHGDGQKAVNDGDYPRAPSSVHRSGGMISADVAVGGPGSLGQFDPPVAKLEATYRASGGAPCDGDAAPAQPDTDDASAQPEMSWSRWLSCFQAADAAAERKEELVAELQDMIAMERYSKASSLKREIDELDAGDAVGCLLRDMDDALAEERYGDAAALRDAGMTGLAGWWAGHADGDPVGHLLHVSPEYGRWTGRALRPRDIAELKVGGAGGGSAPGSTPRPSGQPVLEVFLQAGQGGTAQMAHQAVALRLPTYDEVDRRRHASFLGGASADDTGSDAGASSSASVSAAPHTAGGLDTPIVRLSVSVHADGTATIQLLAPSGSPATSSDGSTDGLPTVSMYDALSTEDVDALLAPGAQTPPPPPLSDAFGAFAGTHNLMQSLSLDEVLDGELDDELPLVGQLGGGTDGQIAGGAFGGGLLGGGSGAAHVPRIDRSFDMESELEHYYTELAREPARVELVGKDHLVLTVTGYHAGTALGGIPRGIAPRAPSLMPMAAASAPAWQAVHPSTPSPPSLLRRPAEAASATVHSMLSTTSDESDDDAGAVGTSSFEVVMPLGELLFEAASASKRGSDRDAGVPASPSMVHGGAAGLLPASMLSVLADQVAMSMEAKAGMVAPTEAIMDALNELMRRAAAGEPPSQLSVLLSSTAAQARDGGGAGGARHVATAAAAAAEPSAVVATQGASLDDGSPAGAASVVYRRIPTSELSRTDPLSGLFLGSFGPHGPELLRLLRTPGDEPGEELVQAVKLTGDANVPAGTVSFRARVGRTQRLDARDVYPEELGITARYKGEGLVAQRGFTQPRWVDGELLVFGGHGGPLTGGAGLGFVWAVPGEKRFLILLNRVDLDDLA